MAKKNQKSKQPDLPGVAGKGVSLVVIPAIARAADKYERMKDARCNASPGEIAAKGELKAMLHKHRDELPVTAEGVPFYRHEDAEYLLEEKLKRRRVDDGSITAED